MSEKRYLNMRISKSWLDRGLTYDRVAEAADRAGLTVNDFIGECLLTYLEPKDDYKSLLSKILRIDVSDDVKRLESEVIKKLALKNGIEI